MRGNVPKPRSRTTVDEFIEDCREQEEIWLDIVAGQAQSKQYPSNQQTGPRNSDGGRRDSGFAQNAGARFPAQRFPGRQSFTPNQQYPN